MNYDQRVNNVDKGLVSEGIDLNIPAGNILSDCLNKLFINKTELRSDSENDIDDTYKNCILSVAKELAQVISVKIGYIKDNVIPYIKEFSEQLEEKEAALSKKYTPGRGLGINFFEVPEPMNDPMLLDKFRNVGTSAIPLTTRVQCKLVSSIDMLKTYTVNTVSDMSQWLETIPLSKYEDVFDVYFTNIHESNTALVGLSKRPTVDNLETILLIYGITRGLLALGEDYPVTTKQDGTTVQTGLTRLYQYTLFLLNWQNVLISRFRREQTLVIGVSSGENQRVTVFKETFDQLKSEKGEKAIEALYGYVIGKGSVIRLEMFKPKMDEYIKAWDIHRKFIEQSNRIKYTNDLKLTIEMLYREFLKEHEEDFPDTVKDQASLIKEVKSYLKNIKYDALVNHYMVVQHIIAGITFEPLRADEFLTILNRSDDLETNTALAVIDHLNFYLTEILSVSNKNSLSMEEIEENEIIDDLLKVELVDRIVETD